MTSAEEDLLMAMTTDLDGSFARFVDAYAPAVYTLALRLCHRPADSEDLAAETFANAYTALRGYPPHRIRVLKLRSWLVTIVLNLWRNQLRSAGRRPTLISLDLTAHDTPDERTGPEDRALGLESLDRLADLVATLPDPQRITVVLRHVLDLSYAEIAEATGYPAGTAKSHVSRGLATLRYRLTDSEEASL